MKNCYKLAITGAIFVFGLGTLNVAQAATVSLSSSNKGWWNTGGSSLNDNYNDNYITGNYKAKGYHSFFTFNLGALAGVSSATLQVQRFDGSGNRTKTLGFFDVSTSADVLSQKVNNPNINIYNDLGSGKNYGTFNVSTFGNSKEILSFVLNSDAIADINTRSGELFSIGGALLGDLEIGDQYLFGNSIYSSAKLVVDGDLATVPEPGTLGGAVLAGITGSWLKRKRRRSKLYRLIEFDAYPTKYFFLKKFQCSCKKIRVFLTLICKKSL